MKKISVLLLVCSSAYQIGCGGGGGTRAPKPLTITINSTPSTVATQGVAYTYSVKVTVSNQSPATYHLSTAPTGVVLNGSALTWTPDQSQSRATNHFSIEISAGGTTVKQDWQVITSGNVNASKINTHVTEFGDEVVPLDVTSLPLAASFSSSAGEFTMIEATGDQRGQYVFTAVPPGSYWLQDSLTNTVVTSKSLLDLGSDVLGRPGMAMPTSPTNLRLELVDLAPWRDRDRQQLFVLNTGTLLDFEWGLAGLNVGSTELSEDLNWTYPLIASSKGDVVYITQLVDMPTIANSSLQVFTRAARPISIEQVDGADTTIREELDDMDLNSSLHANIKGTLFAQVARQMSPLAQDDSTYFYVEADAAGSEKGQIGSSPDLLRFSGYGSPLRTDMDLGTIAYANPYPSAWAKFLDYLDYVHVDYMAPGSTTATRQYAYQEIQTTSWPDSDKPISPLISAVVSPKINGVDFFADQSGVPVTPTLTWNPPSLGTPTGYIVEVVQIYNDSGNSMTSNVGRSYSTTNSVQIGPGIIEPGKSYLFRVSCVYQPGVDFGVEPFRNAFPRSVVQSLSGVISF